MTPVAALLRVALISFIVKLWLTSETRIEAIYGPHDALNYLEHAKFIALGQWFGPYNQYTLIKQPFFPLYLAGLQEVGIPVTIAHVIVYGAACYLACIAVRPLVRNTFMLCMIFVVLYFNPMENSSISWGTTRSQVSGTLTLLVISCAIALYLRRTASFRRNLPWTLGLALSLAAFWLNREESIWIVGPLAALTFAYIDPVLRDRRWPALWPRLASVAIPLLMVCTAVAGIMLINGKIYGWYATSELSSPVLVSAYNSLTRIDPLVATDSRFPVPRAAREIAYRVSPAAAELRSYLEGPNGGVWAAYGCTTFHVCGDIHGGWFIWALREAIATLGYYDSGPHAKSFYKRLANEIDSACDSGKIACRPKNPTMLPPFTVADVAPLTSNLAQAIRVGIDFEEFTFDPGVSDDLSVRGDYDFVVRSVDDHYGNEPIAKDDPLKRAILIDIARTYQLIVPIATVLAIVFVLLRAASLVSRHPLEGDSEYLVPAVVVAIGFGSLAFVLALATTLAVADIITEYVSPLFPLILFFVSLVIAVEAPVYFRALERRMPAAQA